MARRNVISLSYRGNFGELVAGANAAAAEVSKSMNGVSGIDLTKTKQDLAAIKEGFVGLASEVAHQVDAASKRFETAARDFQTAQSRIATTPIIKTGTEYSSEKHKVHATAIYENLANDHINQTGISIQEFKANKALVSELKARAKQMAVDMDKHQAEVVPLINDLFSGVAAISNKAEDALTQMLGLTGKRAAKVKALYELLDKEMNGVVTVYREMNNASEDIAEFANLRAKSIDQSKKTEDAIKNLKRVMIANTDSIFTALKEANKSLQNSIADGDRELKALGAVTDATRQRIIASRAEAERKAKQAERELQQGLYTPANARMLGSEVGTTTRYTNDVNERLGYEISNGRGRRRTQVTGSYETTANNNQFIQQRREAQVRANAVYESADAVFTDVYSMVQGGGKIAAIKDKLPTLEKAIEEVSRMVGIIEAEYNALQSAGKGATPEGQAKQILLREAQSQLRMYQRGHGQIRSAVGKQSFNDVSISGETNEANDIILAIEELKRAKKDLKIASRRVAVGADGVVDSSDFQAQSKTYLDAKDRLAQAMSSGSSLLTSENLSVAQAAALRKAASSAESVQAAEYRELERLEDEHQMAITRIVEKHTNQRKRQLKEQDEAANVKAAYERFQAFHSSGGYANSANAGYSVHEDSALLSQLFHRKKNSDNEAIRQAILGDASGDDLRSGVMGAMRMQRNMVNFGESAEVLGGWRGQLSSILGQFGMTSGLAERIAGGGGGGGAFNRANNALSNTINKRFSQVGGLAGLPIYGLGAAGFAVSGGSMALGASFEREGMQNSLAGIINQFAEIKDTTGQLVDNAQLFNLSLREGSKFYDEIRKKANASILTTKELFNYVSAGAPQLLGKGLSKNQSLDVIDRIASIGKGLGLQETAVMSDIRDFATGQVTVRSQVLRAIGMDGNRLKAAAARGGDALYDEFNQSFKGFEPAYQRIKELGMSSRDRAVDAGQQALAAFGDSLGKGAVPALNAITDKLNEANNDGTFDRAGKSVVNFMEDIGVVVGSLGRLMPASVESITNAYSLAATALGGFAIKGTLANFGDKNRIISETHASMMADAFTRDGEVTKAAKDAIDGHAGAMRKSAIATAAATVGIEYLIMMLVNGAAKARSAMDNSQSAVDDFSKAVENGAMGDAGIASQKRASKILRDRGFKGLMYDRGEARTAAEILQAVQADVGGGNFLVDLMQGSRDMLSFGRYTEGVDIGRGTDDGSGSGADINRRQIMEGFGTSDLKSKFAAYLKKNPPKYNSSADMQKSFADFVTSLQGEATLPIDVLTKYSMKLKPLGDQYGVKLGSDPLNFLTTLQGKRSTFAPGDARAFDDAYNRLVDDLAEGKGTAIDFKSNVGTDPRVTQVSSTAAYELRRQLSELDAVMSRLTATTRDASGSFVKLSGAAQRRSLQTGLAAINFASTVANMSEEERRATNPEFAKASLEFQAAQDEAQRAYEEEARTLREAIIARQKEVQYMKMENDLSAEQLALDKQAIEISRSERMASPGSLNVLGAMYNQMTADIGIVKKRQTIENMKSGDSLAAAMRANDPMSAVMKFFGTVESKGIKVSLDQSIVDFLGQNLTEFKSAVDSSGAVFQDLVFAVRDNTTAVIAQTAKIGSGPGEYNPSHGGLDDSGQLPPINPGVPKMRGNIPAGPNSSPIGGAMTDAEAAMKAAEEKQRAEYDAEQLAMQKRVQYEADARRMVGGSMSVFGQYFNSRSGFLRSTTGGMNLQNLRALITGQYEGAVNYLDVQRNLTQANASDIIAQRMAGVIVPGAKSDEDRAKMWDVVSTALRTGDAKSLGPALKGLMSDGSSEEAKNAISDMVLAISGVTDSAQAWRNSMDELARVNARLQTTLEDVDFAHSQAMSSMQATRDYDDAVMRSRYSTNPGADMLRARGALTVKQLEQQLTERGRFLPELSQVSGLMNSPFFNEMISTSAFTDASASSIEFQQLVARIGKSSAEGMSKDDIAKRFYEETGVKASNSRTFQAAMLYQGLGGGRFKDAINGASSPEEVKSRLLSAYNEAMRDTDNLSRAIAMASFAFENAAQATERYTQAQENVQNITNDIALRRATEGVTRAKARLTGNTAGLADNFLTGFDMAASAFADDQRLAQAKEEAAAMQAALDESNAHLANLVSLGVATPAAVGNAVAAALSGGAGTTPAQDAVSAELKNLIFGSASAAPGAANALARYSGGLPTVGGGTNLTANLRAIGLKYQMQAIGFANSQEAELLGSSGMYNRLKLMDATTATAGNFAQAALSDPFSIMSFGGLLRTLGNSASPITGNAASFRNNAFQTIGELMSGNITNDMTTPGRFGFGRDVSLTDYDKLVLAGGLGGRAKKSLQNRLFKNQLTNIGRDYAGSFVGNWMGRQIGGDAQTVSMFSDIGSSLGASGAIFGGLGAWAGPAGAALGGLVGGLFGGGNKAEEEELRRWREGIQSQLSSIDKGIMKLGTVADYYNSLSSTTVMGAASLHLSGRFGNAVGLQDGYGIRG